MPKMTGGGGQYLAGRMDMFVRREAFSGLIQYSNNRLLGSPTGEDDGQTRRRGITIEEEGWKRERIRPMGRSGRLKYADQGQLTGSSVSIRSNSLKIERVVRLELLVESGGAYSSPTNFLTAHAPYAVRQTYTPEINHESWIFTRNKKAKPLTCTNHTHRRCHPGHCKISAHPLKQPIPCH
jgi:hypothetical protein